MHVVLKVLASTSIKRRKPWPRLAWIGKENQNLLLLGERRISILFMPSGKTKRKISKLHALIKDCVSLAYTSNGLYLVGLLSTGNLFVWCKDSDVVSHISGLVDLQARSQSNYKWRPKLFSSDDCSKMLVVVVGQLSTEIYLYQGKPYLEQNNAVDNNKSSAVWWRCGTDVEVSPLQSRVSKDMALDAQFISDDIFGRCCCVAFIHSSESAIIIVTLMIQWFPNNAIPVHHWHKMALPYARLSIGAKQVTRKGAFVARWSHDGRILAIAVNQEAVDQDQLVFVSPHCKVLFITTLPREYSGLRHHRWVCDLAWTWNDMFVVTINHLGSICLLSRLGEPLSIASSGCSMDLPVSLSLNIHPFIFVRPHNVSEKDCSTATTDILKQRFSLFCHPRLPMFLCSDGYMATCLQFPQALMDPLKFVDVCCHQTEKYLRVMQKCVRLACATLDLTEEHTLLAFTLQKSTIQIYDTGVHNRIGLDSWEMLPLDNEEPSESDSSNLKSEQVLHHYSSVGKFQSGSLVFGAQDMDGTQFMPGHSVNKALSLQQLLNDTIKATGSFLLSVWGLLVTVNETWTKEWEEQARKASDLLVKVCAAFLSSFYQSVGIDQISPESPFPIVTSLIFNLMNLCRFSSLNKSIMPVVLNALFSTFNHLIKCAEKLPLHLRVMHLIQLSNLVESAEKSFSVIFGIFANQLLHFSPQNNRKNAVFTTDPLSKSSRSKKSVLRNRLTPIWITLYNTTVKLISDFTDRDEKSISFLGRLQRKLQDLNIDLNLNKMRHKVGKAEKVLLCDPFKYENAAEQWKLQVETSLEGTDDKSQKTSARLLHSILYALLGGYHIKDAISLIYWLLTRDRANQVERGLRHPAIRHTIRSFARFMAAYFVGDQLRVYPFHCPRYFPSLQRHQTKRTCQRVVPVCRSTLMQSLSFERVAYHWTAEVTISLFLSSGYIKEAAELVNRLGDWKTAFVLFYASRIASDTYSSKLISRRILDAQLWGLTKSHCSSHYTVKHSLQRVSSFRNCFLAGALCDIDVVTLNLEHQMQELQNLIRKLPLIVPTNVYLPHPPPYCPQPSEQNHITTESEEEKLRCQIARHVQAFIVILQTLQCTACFMEIYLSDVFAVIKRVTRVKELSYEEWPLQDLFLKLKRKLGEFEHLQAEQRQRLITLTAHFRDFCSVCWFLHVRDKMNMHLRRFWQQLIKNSSMPAKFCLNTLQWAVHLIPFSEVVGWNLDVYHLIISVLLEAPRDRRSSLILAQCFPDMSQIPTELDYRISSLLNVWRSVVIKVPSNRRQMRTTKTLSVIHLSQCDGVRNVLNQLKGILGDFDKNVLNSPKAEHFTRFETRVFEIEKDYFMFLELMFDVGIIKDNLEDDTALAEIPILDVFKDKLRQQYLVQPLLSDKGNFNGMDRKRDAIHKIFVDAKALKETKTHLKLSSSANQERQSKKAGMFRSLSLTELNPKNPIEISTFPLSGRVKSLSNLDRPRTKKSPKTEPPPILPKCSSLLALCDAIDVDQAWKTLSSRRQMLDVLSWLVKWMKRDECAGNVTEEGTNSAPRMKIQITFSQLVSAIQQAMKISDERKRFISISSRKKRSERSFVTSTPLTENKLRRDNSTKGRKHRSQFIMEDSFAKVDDSEWDKESESNISDKRTALMQHLHGAECSKGGQFEVSTLTADNSFSSLDLYMNLPSEVARVSDDLMSATTSRWTNSGQFSEIPSKLTVVQSSVKRVSSPDLCNDPRKTLVEPPASTLSSLNIIDQQKHFPNNHITLPDSSHVSTKDFACGDGRIWGSRLVDTCIQVNDKSLVETHIHLDKKNEHLIEDDHPSTCDDTQKDACSIPISTSVSYGEALSMQNRINPPNELQENITRSNGHGKSQQRNSERDNAISMVKTSARVNESPDFTQIRLLRLPAEKELCPNINARQRGIRTGPTLPDNKPQQIPALLQLDPECKLIKNAALLINEQVQLKMLSHEEIQLIRSKLQGSATSKSAGTASKKVNLPKYSVPPLLQLRTSSPNLKYTVDGNHRTALTTESSAVVMPRTLATHSQGSQTNAERGFCKPTSKSSKPKTLAVSSRGVQTRTEGRQHTTATSSQTLTVTMKNTSMLTDCKEWQHASTGTDVPANPISIGTNTLPQNEIPKDSISNKHSLEKPEQTTKQTSVETLTVVKATQTEDLVTERAISGTIQHYNSHMDDLKPSTGVASKSMPPMELLIDPNNVSGIEVDLEDTIINNNVKIQSAQPEAKDMLNKVLDLKGMRERLNRLQNEGWLNEDVTSLTYKNRQLHDEKPTPASINVEAVKILPVESNLRRKSSKEPDVRAELLEWMKSRKAMQQKEFKSTRESLQQMEKEPFVSDAPTRVKKDIVEAEEQRKKRQQLMHSEHYNARKSEVAQLIQEVARDKAPPVRKIVQLRRSQPIVKKRHKVTPQSVPGIERNYPHDPSATYVLKGNPPHSLPASPSRKIVRSNYVSCPASPKNSRTRMRPTTYIERLQALQSPRIREKCHRTNTAVSQDYLEEGMHSPQFTTISETSSCETLSPWIVPDEVHHLLFGKTYQSLSGR